MGSTLQSVVTSIQINDCVSRMLVDLGASYVYQSYLSFLVAILTAIGYDYSE